MAKMTREKKNENILPINHSHRIIWLFLGNDDIVFFGENAELLINTFANNPLICDRNIANCTKRNKNVFTTPSRLFHVTLSTTVVMWLQYRLI